MFGRPQAHKPDQIDLASLSLLEALEVSERCPVCQLADKACEGNLWILLWESVNDPGVRCGIRRALGFCPRHTLRLCQVANAEGLGMTGPAIIFADVLTAIRERLQTRRSKLAPDALCPICAQEQEITQDALHAVLQAVHHPRLSPLIRQRGLCQRHYRMARFLPAQRRARALLQTYQEAHMDRQATLLATSGAHAMAAASAGMLRGEVPWPPVRSAGTMQARRGTALQAASAATTLCDALSCPICMALVELRQTHRHTWLTALPADSPERAAFIAAGGVCRGHAGVLDDLAPEALRELYAAAWAVARATLAAAPQPTRAWLIRSQSPEVDPLPCPLGAEADRAGHAMAEELAQRTAAEGMLYCLPYLRPVLQAVPRDRVSTLRAQQGHRLGALVAELNEFVRKSDWHYRDEPKGSEQGAWARAAAFFAGPLLMLDS